MTAKMKITHIADNISADAHEFLPSFDDSGIIEIIDATCDVIVDVIEPEDSMTVALEKIDTVIEDNYLSCPDEYISIIYNTYHRLLDTVNT